MMTRETVQVALLLAVLTFTGGPDSTSEWYSPSFSKCPVWMINYMITITKYQLPSKHHAKYLILGGEPSIYQL